MRHIKVWDPAIRLFHWLLVAAFLSNVFLTKPGKQVHEWVGYGVLALLAFRVIWGMIGPRHARFSDFPPSASAALDQAAEMASWRRHPHAGHSPLGALMVYNMLAVFLAIGLSGWMTTTITFYGVKWVKELHEALVTWAEISVVVHVLAVAIESRRLGVSLSRAMVTGYKTLP